MHGGQDPIPVESRSLVHYYLGGGNSNMFFISQIGSFLQVGVKIRWWQLKYVLFSSKMWGFMIQFDEDIFQMGGSTTT